MVHTAATLVFDGRKPAAIDCLWCSLEAVIFQRGEGGEKSTHALAPLGLVDVQHRQQEEGDYEAIRNRLHMTLGFWACSLHRTFNLWVNVAFPVTEVHTQRIRASGGFEVLYVLRFSL